MSLANLIKPVPSEIVAMTRNAAEMKQQLIEWALQNSGTRNPAGLAAMRQMLAQAFSDRLGAPAETVSVAGALDGNSGELGAALRLRKYPEAPRQVLLSGHMDTVFGPESPFQRCARGADGRLIGPGVADMKGGLVVMLEALATLEASPLAGQLGWTVLITADEEIGSPGSRRLLIEEARRNDLGMVFESSLPEGEMIGTRKGNGTFRARTGGRAAHTGRDPESGRNAIVLLADWIREVESIPALFPGVTVNVGKIGGGGPLNIVPDSAWAEWSLRLPPGVDADEVAQELTARAHSYDEREGFSLTWEGGFTAPPLDLTPVREHWMQQFQATATGLGRSLGRRDTGGSSDGNLLHAAGLPVLDGIGVRGGNLHQVDEFVVLESLVERAQLSACFLLRLAAGEIPSPPVDPDSSSRP